MRSTIVDIKNRTGLSLATISKYLNGGNVLPENKIKIDEAVKALNYQVNENARSLVTNQTRVMGVIVFSVENLFVGTLLRYIGEYLRKHGYGMMICDSNKNPEAEKQNIRSMVQKNVDGIIIMPVSDDPSCLKIARDAGIPVICLDRVFREDDCDSVLVSNRQTTERLVDILIRNHHRKIAVISSHTEYTGQERLSAFIAAIDKAGIRIPDEYIISAEGLSISSGYEGMQQLLSLPEPPTAVFLCNYEILIGAVMAVSSSGFSYPDDVSLIAFDSMIFSEIIRPRITGAVQPTEQLAYRAAELLILRAEEKKNGADSPPQHIVLDTDIQEHESVKDIA